MKRVALALGLLAACEGPRPPREGPLPRARFVMPVEGDTVASQVLVVLAVDGVELAPAGRRREGRAHLHVLVDADLPPADRPIATEEREIVHLDGGETHVTLQGLAPGEHRLIAVLATGDEMRLRGARADTIHVIVQRASELPLVAGQAARR